MTDSDFEKYYQKGGTYVLPIEVFNELFGEMENWKKECKQKENIIKEVREWAKKYSCQFTNDDGELVVSEISFNIQARPCDLFKILDKEVN